MRCGVVEAVEGVFDFAVTQVDAELVFGDVLDIVGLVDDDVVVFWEQVEVGFLEDEVAEHKGVIGDDNVGVVESSSCAAVEAILEVAALSAGTVAVFAADGVPGLGAWGEGYIA